MNAWPPNLPGPKMDTWRTAEPDRVRRSQMDCGPEKIRVMSTAVGAVEQWRLILEEWDRNVLREFYDANEALRFSMDHFFWGACEATFAGPIEWSRFGKTTWQADFSLKVYR